jgi:SAM-dependent methyltransferase
MSAAEERLANDPSSELWGEHRSRYRFAIEGSGARGQGPGARGQGSVARCQYSVVKVPEPVAHAQRGAATSAPPAARLRAGATGPEVSPAPAAARLPAGAAGGAGEVGTLKAEPRRGGGDGGVAGLVVLDVASGAGFGLEMLGQAGARAIGVDYDGGALLDVRRRRQHERLVRGDATCLPLKDASADLVVSFETIEHVPDAEALVLEIRRVLKPGGRLVLSTPNRDFGPPERHTGNPFHVREFTADELRDLLRASFEQVQLFGQRPSAAYRYVPFLMLERQNAPSALAWKLLVRLPFELRNRLALALSGRPFYPGEDDYRFVPEACDGAHALVAVAC